MYLSTYLKKKDNLKKKYKLKRQHIYIIHNKKRHND